MRLLAILVSGLLVLIGFSVFAILAGGDALVLATARRIDAYGPDVASLVGWRPPLPSEFYLDDGRLVSRLGVADHRWTPLARIPPLVINAFLAAEDKTFWTNPGIDPIAIARSALHDARHLGRRPAGASTIAQQVVKNLLLGNRPMTLSRKVEQAVLALRAVRQVGRPALLENYLNEIYLGGGAYGVAAAARRYFSANLNELTLPQAALLGGLPKDPNGLDPRHHPAAALDRRAYVIGRMAADGMISQAQAQVAATSPLGLTPSPLAPRIDASIPGQGWAVDAARHDAKRRFGPGFQAEGLRFTLTLSSGIQALAQHALEQGVMAWSVHRHGWHGRLGHAGTAVDLGRFPLPARCTDQCPSWTQVAMVQVGSPSGLLLENGSGQRWQVPTAGFAWIAGGNVRQALAQLPRGSVVLAGDPLGGERGGWLVQPTRLQGSVVVMDARDGAVLGLSGGLRHTPDGFDRALAARRQPGSTFKPFIYLTALERGFSPDSPVLDSAIDLSQGAGLPWWSPQDDNNSFMGLISLRKALAYSRNAAAVRLLWQLGRGTVGQTAAAFGIYGSIATYTAALGSQEVTCIDMTSAYAALANGGVRVWPHVIASYRSAGATDTPWLTKPPVRVASAVSVSALTGMLVDVTTEGTAVNMASLSKRLARHGLVLAAKTGTSSDYKDAWFMGYAGQVAIGVQVGYDTPRSLGPDGFGAVVAGPIFARVMTGLLDADDGRVAR